MSNVKVVDYFPQRQSDAACCEFDFQRYTLRFLYYEFESFVREPIITLLTFLLAS